MCYQLNVVFLGTAGCGKSLLTYKFGEWMESNLNLNVGYVNLDPGCESTPYDPDFDIRRLFTISDLMRREGLGPNGAMIRASQLMEERFQEIAKAITSINAKSAYTLIDTPGQMEIFVFRPTGPRVIGELRSLSRTVNVFIIDPTLALTTSELMVAILLSVAVQLRLETPTVTVINKSDLLKGSTVDRILTRPSHLKRMITEREGVFADLALGCASIVRKLMRASRVIKVSAKTGYGMGALYDLVHEALCVCGDLT